jgi:hypothetical protein
MRVIIHAIWKVLTIGGWFPLVVFFTHLFLSRVLGIYEIYPDMDIPMHFAGGLSIAFFVSKCFRVLPRDYVKKGRVNILEILLIGSITASVAVFWEFGEFLFDQSFGTNIQISLANTIQDLAMGLLGASVIIFIRSRQLHIDASQVREVTFDWLNGRAT